VPTERHSSDAVARPSKWHRAAGVLLLGAAVRRLATRRRASAVREHSAVGPALPLPGPTSAAWREEALTRAQELDALAVWIRTASSEKGNPADEFGERITKHLEAARSTAAGEDRHSWKERLKWWTRLRSSWGGSSIERSTTNLDAVEAHLLRLAPADYVRGEMPSVAAYVCRYLKKDDPRRTRIEQLAQEAEARELLTAEREAVVAAYHAASSQRHRELMRLRSFRNVLVVASAVLLLVVIGLGVLGSLRPQAIPLCFEPETQDGVSLVCPTGEERIRRGDDIDEKIADTVSGWDVWLVEIVGLIAAAVATAFALRGIRGTSTPYSLPVALAILKLPTGALTAVVGLVLMRGGFVPGLSALDSSAQILSWAAVFGYAQQLVTRFVDQQAHAVLEDVGGRGAAGDRPTSAEPTP
jgi:hypothetical protein